MSAKDTDRLKDFDPRDILRRVRSQRTFAERFDSFSDGYVWALAGVIALTYLSSALYGTVYILLGQSVQATVLASAVWDLPAAILYLLPLLPVLVFRFLLYLGPLGLSEAEASWWLPLAVRRHKLLATSWVRALGLGALSSGFCGAVWMIAFAAVSSHWSPAALSLVVVDSLLLGVAMAGLAVGLAARGQTGTAARVCRWLTGVWTLGFLVLWAALLIGANASSPPVSAPVDQLKHTWGWGGAAALLAAAVIALLWSRNSYARTAGNSLRSAGANQQRVAGLLSQGDLRFLDTHRSATARRRTLSASLTGRFPVGVRILILRWIRQRLAGGILRVVVLSLVILSALEHSANPLTLAVLTAVLIGVLNAALARMVQPLAKEPELGSMLGMGSAHMARTVALVSTALAMLCLLAFGALIAAMGLLPPAAWWQWVLAALLTGLGLAGSSLSHARRGERDWEQLFSNGATELTAAAVLMQEALTFIRALLCGAVLYYLLLAGAPTVPAGLWILSGLCALPALAALRR